MEPLHIIGGGLAGSEAAWQAAEAGVPVVLRRYDGLIHGFFGLGPVSPAADAAVRDTTDALRRLLARPATAVA